MIAHHCHENLVGQIQKLAIKCPFYDGGVLVQVTHEVFESRVFMDLNAILARELSQFSLNLFAPCLRPYYHPIRGELLFILLKIPNRQFAFSNEAMPNGFIARGNTTIRELQRTSIKHC